MIFKPYQFSNLKHKKFKLLFIYGQNEGQKHEVIDQILETGYLKIFIDMMKKKYLSNFDNFINELSNKSFFEDKKIIIISRVLKKFIH